MRIGVFGGTFDPPHLGHLILAAEASEKLRLDRLLWVLTSDPPHKRSRSVSTLTARLEMVHAAINDDPLFELSRVDIDRPGPHYAVDTVALLKLQYPLAKLYYLMGGDSLRDLPTWHNAKQFIANCDGLGVMRRPGADIKIENLGSVLEGIHEKVHYVEAPLLEISSQEIRSRILNGKSFRYFLRQPVFELIKERKYYQ